MTRRVSLHVNPEEAELRAPPSPGSGLHPSSQAHSLAPSLLAGHAGARRPPGLLSDTPFASTVGTPQGAG